MFVVLGATGRTGKVVAESLLSRGKRICAVVRDGRKGEPWRRRGAKVVVASLEDEHALERALADATGLFALLPEDATAPDFDAHRRRMADAIAAAVSASDVEKVVLLSGAAAVLPEGNGLAKELHRLESLLIGSGRRVTVLRAVAFQENVTWALPAALQNGIYPNFYPSADVAIKTVATRDIGRLAACRLVEPSGKSEIVDVTGPTYSVRQLAATVGRAMGQTLRIVDIPAAAHVETLTAAGMSRPFAESFAELVACLASGRISQAGDRIVRGKTELEDILPGLLAASAAPYPGRS